MVGKDASSMVAYTWVGVGLSSITCVFMLNYSDAKGAHQRVASTHSTCHTTCQIGFDFGCLQAWRDMEVISLYAQLDSAMAHVLGGLK